MGTLGSQQPDFSPAGGAGLSDRGCDKSSSPRTKRNPYAGPERKPCRTEWNEPCSPRSPRRKGWDSRKCKWKAVAPCPVRLHTSMRQRALQGGGPGREAPNSQGPSHGQLPDLCLCFSFCLKCSLLCQSLLRPSSNAHSLAPPPRSLYSLPG